MEIVVCGGRERVKEGGWRDGGKKGARHTNGRRKGR